MAHAGSNNTRTAFSDPTPEQLAALQRLREIDAQWRELSTERMDAAVAAVLLGVPIRRVGEIVPAQTVRRRLEGSNGWMGNSRWVPAIHREETL